MARYGQRPENALKRANEFMDLEKPARALDTLQEVFRNKKWAYNWSESVLEPIMFRYLELCVELRKSHIAKEGLFQYRNMFQLVNVGSLELVIRGYLRMAEERTESARAQSTQAVIETDDLDNLATPESILLSAVSGEDAQDRSDRTILTPWVKFLWESYCQCLELLRTNAHVETLYHDIARMAFQFCLKYARKTEFRKLCDKLRKHLEDICKLTVQTGNVSIAKPETQQLNLETRLFQLDSAIQMELWQEAYKAIEDIHNLMNMSKKTPVAKTMANYYGKLALVFWKAGHCLFHAAALLKLFQLSREMKKNITQEELQKMACRVLVATLSIPLPSLHPEFDRFVETDKSPMEKAQRLAVLLGLAQPPTRVSLLKDIVRLNVVALASPQLQQLYSCLEVDLDPLNMCPRINSVIASILDDQASPLGQYVGALKDVALLRLIRQVAQCYQCIKFERLLELAETDDIYHVERLLVDCVRHNDMQIRIDHATRSIQFGTDGSGGEWCSTADDENSGPRLQPMPSDQVRGQLVRCVEVLTKCVTIVRPANRKAERDRARAAMVHHYHENKQQEHQRVLQRHKIIEDRKEYIERLNTVREEEEQRRQEEQHRVAAVAEARRLEVEREERERRRLATEQREMRERHLKERMAIISQTSRGADIIKKLEKEDMSKMDAETIAAREMEELMKERRELQARLKSQEKKIDYLERAKRLEEIPLLQKSLEEKQVQDKAFFEQQEKERIAALIEARARDVATQARLVRMHVHRDAFVARLRADRGAAHEKRLQQFEQKLAAEREKRLAERRQQRINKRKQDWYEEKQAAYERAQAELLRQKEEEEQRQREERERKLADEERERREKKEKQDREHAEYLERVAAKARAREAEIQEKLDREREAASQQTNAWRRGETERARGPEKEDTWRRPAAAAAAPDRDEKKDTWRGRSDQPRSPDRHGARDEPPHDDRRTLERGPPRDETGPPREDRAPPPRDDRRPPPREDDRRPPPREDDRRPPPREKIGAWRSTRPTEPEKPRYAGRSSAPDSGNSWRRGPAEPLPVDRDRDRERPSAGAWRSAKDGPREFGRDRDGPREFGRDRDGPRDLGRDRDGPRRDDRDREPPKREERRPPPPPRREEKPRDPDGWEEVTRR